LAPRELAECSPNADLPPSARLSIWPSSCNCKIYPRIGSGAACRGHDEFRGIVCGELQLHRRGCVSYVVDLECLGAVESPGQTIPQSRLERETEISGLPETSSLAASVTVWPFFFALHAAAAQATRAMASMESDVRALLMQLSSPNPRGGKVAATDVDFRFPDRGFVGRPEHHDG